VAAERELGNDKEEREGGINSNDFEISKSKELVCVSLTQIAQSEKGKEEN